MDQTPQIVTTNFITLEPKIVGTRGNVCFASPDRNCSSIPGGVHGRGWKQSLCKGRRLSEPIQLARPGGALPYIGFRYMPPDRVWFLRVSILKHGILFDFVDVVIRPVLSLVRVPLLCQLKFKCVNAQLSKKLTVSWTQLYLKVTLREPFNWFKKDLCVPVNLFFFRWILSHFSSLLLKRSSLS